LRITRIIQRHWHERGQYASSIDWLLSIYNRILIHLPRAPLPGRGRVVRVRPVGLSHPLFVRLASSDWYVLEEIFLNGEYEHIARTPRGVKTVLDLGANVGMSVRFWQTLFPGVRVIAVEPDEQNLAMARRNVMESPAVTFIRACVAGRARDVWLDRSSNEYSISMRDQRPGSTAQESLVPALTVPQVLERAGFAGEIDLLKCDIEGAEAEVFADCAAWIGRVGNIAIELHAPYTAQRFLEDLRRNGSEALRVTADLPKGDLHVLYLSTDLET
jgi:FkbM family methyltransferase